MPTQISAIEEQARERLEELSPRHWTSPELTKIIVQGIKNLWRSIVDLKGEHYLVVNTTDVTLPANTDRLQGVPRDVHKVYLIEPADTSTDSTGSGRGLVFRPFDYKHDYFTSARSQSAIDTSSGGVIYYAITGLGGPTQAPIIYAAPKINAAIALRFTYIPTLPSLDSASVVPIPGEADSALIAWCVAYARAKERDDRAPDPAWLQVYENEKLQLLQSLGLRQYQESQVAEAMFESYW